MKNETKYHILKSPLSEYQYVITTEKQNNKKSKKQATESMYI